MSNGLYRLVQLSLVDRINKRHGMHRAGPLLVLLRVAPGTDFGFGKPGIRFVPFDQRRIVWVELAVYREVVRFRRSHSRDTECEKGNEKNNDERGTVAYHGSLLLM